MFGVDLANVVGTTFSGQLGPLTLRKTPNAADTDPLTGPAHGTTTNYSCEGIVTDFENSEFFDVKEIQKGDQRVLIIGAMLNDAGVAPEKDDYILTNTRTLVVVRVHTRPENATYVCLCRG